MSVPFNAAYGLIVIPARLRGPTGETHLRLALDTGATSTVVRVSALISIGIDPVASRMLVQMTTGNSVQQSPKVSVIRIDALGRHQLDFLVIAHTIPASAGVDGVLGLDFLRSRRLTVDFRKGQISLA
jgi:predicted aspartyl protease